MSAWLWANAPLVYFAGVTPRATTSLLGLLALFTGMLAAPLLSLTGCEGGQCQVPDCPYGQTPYTCYATQGQGDVTFCMGGPELADLECAKMGGNAVEPFECANDDEAGLEEWPSGWPASEVTEISAGVHSVSKELEIALRDDWSLLLNDSARFVPGPHDYFALQSVAPDDLWAKLGFESGDVFVRLNGHDLAGLAGVGRTYEAVVLDTRFVVEYLRAGQLTTTTLVLE